MAIIDPNAVAEEAVKFDNVFVKTLVVEQKLATIKQDMGVFSVKLVYVKFAVMTNESIVFSKEYKTIYIANYTEDALAKAAAGDLDLINALGAIQVAISSIIAERTGMTLLVK